MNIEASLKDAIETGEVLKVRYHGGSQSGALREIAPISVNGDKVRARCYSSDAVKTFVIRKVEIVGFAKKGDEWQKGKEQKSEYVNLSCVFEENANLFDKLGWHIESELSGDRQFLSLHARFKNGNLKKGAEIELSYEKYAYEMVVDWVSDSEYIEPVPEITRERKRPWTARAKKEATKSFGSLDKAAVPFLEWAEKYAPSKN
ncbi:hypothetical protein [Vreelandella lionensis]|uniref:hypothetical protein n=1 Tax=Halomonadaceae TaxID=28256 RepID=UPI0009F58B27|nr:MULTISPECIES: hypothetical protein [Halomonas]MCP1319566.1 hypothetical protein [Halomonas sp. 707B3]